MNGVICVYKPKGISSHDCIYKVRRALGTKRVGHTGTLDPMAEGVLPICVGKATRASEMIMASEKVYKAEITFGAETTTADSEGEITRKSDKIVTKEEFLSILPRFIGEIEQIPPMYSAIHHQGKRLYQLAREGKEVERKPRKITIFNIELLSFSGDKAEIRVTCSKGTYIRTLCEDLGRAAGGSAHMSALIREQSGIFTIENSVKPEDITEDKLIPVDEMFKEYESIILNAENEGRVLNGAPIKYRCREGEIYRLYGEGGNFLCLSKGIMEEGESLLKMVKSFY